MTLRLASGPVSWGVDFADRPGNPDWNEVLDGIAAAGYSGTELGPYGYLPARPAPYELRRLTVTGGFVFEPLHDPAQRSRIVRFARDVASRIGALGGGYLLIIDSVTDERAATAGRTDDASRLDPAARDAMADTIAAIARVAEEAAVLPLVHPHAGTYIEFADEVDELGDVCGFCLDTGHCAYAGIDPVEFYAAAPERVGCIHLKDLDRERVRSSFWDSVAAGAFVPLGRGVVDLAALVRATDDAGYEGWMVVEQDRAAPAGDPVSDLQRSRRHLEGLAVA
ncbi:MAG: sugar phosphate isomerase/epimerase family protein [Solirubrobacteraceae bacterium]